MDQQLFQYTEQSYATKQQIQQQFPQSVADLIWQEILQYRQPLMKKTMLGKKEVCECRLLIKSLFDLEHLLRLANHQNDVLLQEKKWISSLAQANLTENQICNLIQYQQMPAISWHDFLLKLQKDELVNPLDNDCRFLLATSCLAECILELNYLNLTLSYRLLLAYGLLIQVGLAKQLSLFSPCDLLTMLQMKNGMSDQTNELLEIANRLTSLLLQNMLYLQRCNKDSSMRNQDRIQLELHYPQLKQHQLQFYLENREPGCCYTLSQFSKQTKVGYETARQAMEQLVTLGFYTKSKVGKKFIYQSR